ncbi:hypothetical protein Ciccas_003028 [Cichlidogyrus casuarinus]|uniref:Uncharacterized protein n=1 Tax=Cichlidogyrus casuarinus TaxID=1844966 RepID=A0ABD2QFJ2_9PLAT
MRIFNENLDSATSKLETLRKRYKYVSTVSQAMREELQQLTEKANAVDSEEKRLESDLVKKLEELEKKKLDLTNAFLALKQEHASKLTTFRGFPDIVNPTLEPELQVKFFRNLEKISAHECQRLEPTEHEYNDAMRHSNV